MKKVHALIRLGSRLENKYADSQSLQQIIENASSYGKQSANGIMNFLAQLKADQADLSFTVTVKPATFGGENVEVSQLSVEPAQFASRYSMLPEQIKKYLERHVKDFPQIERDTPIVLRFTGKDAGSGIASNP
jgi:hypothetical protein